MTYCVALRLKEGLVFVSDTRTNAGVDHISSFRKLFSFGVENERFMAVQTAGNLATTQAVIAHLKHQIAAKIEPNLYSVATMFEAAELVGQCLRKVIKNIADSPEQESLYGCSIILGGQISGQETELYNIYSQGNFIKATVDTPYFQIGEIKYGKPIMDRALNFYTSLDEALRCSLISFDSTIRSNVSVGMPLDVLVYPVDSLKVPQGKRVFDDDPYFQNISKQWSDTLKKGLQILPEPTADYFN
ncbi:proteasome-type protease [Acinetobacter populi]|jgi:putative proteasome-type protease|uniref:Peptidase n=1 Tax=Acinetobacter populi TaxID=1582270 RepID=A0A1Z9Z1A9_9GAMM|nr:proteasome-type protease [Acinetobacter populi]MCH4246244.1 proteasome-type protease [Acinetobacter populi]OUY08244.1 peptidase [Acinetobacter populi]